MTSDDQVTRLKFLREKRELESVRVSADRYAIPYETMKKYANGTRPLQPDDALKIANYHRVAPQWVLYGIGRPENQYAVRKVGFVAAGSQIELFGDAQSAGETEDAVISEGDCIAVEFRGNSMMPLVYPGDVGFFKEPRRPVERLLGKECIVQLEDGRWFFKVLERGSGPALYDLHSYNEETMRDEIVAGVGEFLGIKRGPGRPGKAIRRR